MIEIDENTNKRTHDEQASAKIKMLENPSEDAPMSNEIIIEKPTIVEEKGEN